METWFARSLILYISIHITKYPPCWRNRLPKPLRSSSGGAQVRINAQVLGTRWGYGGMDISWYFLGILLSNKNAERRFQWGINGIQWDSKTSWGFYNEKRLKPTILQRIWGIPVTKSGIRICHGWSKTGCTPKLQNDVQFQQRTEAFHPKPWKIK